VRRIDATVLRKVAGISLALACWACSPTGTVPDGDWNLYKQNYISREGRVIDTGNGGISHSEGQGIGLLLAAHNRDHAAFDSIWQWTRINLQIRDDKLVAWKWVPGDAQGEGGGKVADRNNATDGDLFIAWALYRAGRQWNDAAYLQAGTEISRDIRAKLLRQGPHGLLLLPGEHGFVKEDGVTVNLSYWVFPALQDLNQLDPAPEWAKLIDTGLGLLRSGRFGRWQLPPDWLRVAEPPVPAPDFPPRFGYNAVRIPLYLIWARLDSPDNLKPFNEFWEYFRTARFVPAWTSLADDSVDSHDAPQGFRAVIGLTRLKGSANPKHDELRLPEINPGEVYYSASLLLLAKLAARESAAQ
jgi:endo-1,4-beta-D-glucanase Y